MKKIISLFAIALLVSFSPALVAQAKDFGQKDDSNQVSTSFDSVTSKDQDFYKKFNIEEKFGINFRPHIRVCGDSLSSDAHCNARVLTDPNGKPSTSSSFPSGYGPAQLRGGYSIGGLASSKKIIAIVDAYDDPNIASDLNFYSATFGLPALPNCVGPMASSSVACFQKVNQRGSTTSHPSSNSGWALEISLDVEASHAMCQNCSLLLVEADSASYSNLMTAVDTAVLLGANVVSNSYGSNEFTGENSYDSHFNHPGIAFTFSAGDSGYGAEYPASSPYVTSVGGTSLFLNQNNSYKQELVWSGTGSGCSAIEPKPSFQTDTLCAKRTVADVSADADPNTGAAVYDTVRYGGTRGWFQVGGTSLASPIIAAIYAIGGTPAATAENSLPYANISNLHDVTSGSNGSCGNYLCNAAPGYDGPTGLGSPNGPSSF